MRANLRSLYGLIVQQEDAGVASRRSRCDSGWVHSKTQSRGPTATTLGSHPGNDGSIPSGTTDYAQIRQPAERLGSDPRVCRFDSCSGYSKKYVLVEQRSARLPVTQEIVGSNPIGDAQHGTVRQSGRATKFKPWWMGVRVPLVLLRQHASAGHWRAQVAVTHPQSLWRFDSVPTH